MKVILVITYIEINICLKLLRMTSTRRQRTLWDSADMILRSNEFLSLFSWWNLTVFPWKWDLHEKLQKMYNNLLEIAKISKKKIWTSNKKEINQKLQKNLTYRVDIRYQKRVSLFDFEFWTNIELKSEILFLIWLINLVEP